jgi:hypothetical protein
VELAANGVLVLEEEGANTARAEESATDDTSR